MVRKLFRSAVREISAQVGRMAGLSHQRNRVIGQSGNREIEKRTVTPSERSEPRGNASRSALVCAGPLREVTRHGFKTRGAFQEGHLDHSRRSIALLADDEFGQAF